MRLLFIIGLVSIIGITDCMAQTPSNNIRKGNRQYKNEQYSDAEIQYRRALEINENSAPANSNLGSTLYKQEEYEAAESKYQKAIEGTATKNSQPSDYWYNLGNTYFQQNKLNESIEAYKSALRLNPSDFDAKHNLMLAQQMQQQQQQQQQQDKNKDQEQDNDQDQQQNQDKNQDQQEQQNQQNQDQQQNQQQEQNQNQQQQPREGQISKEDAERLLKALDQDEKDVQKKLQEEKAKARKVPSDKEW